VARHRLGRRALFPDPALSGLPRVRPEAARLRQRLLLHLPAREARGDAPEGHGHRRQAQIRRHLPEPGPGRRAGAAVRFKAPLSGTTVLDDVVKGSIVFQNEELDDFIICRSDGTPTYNFAVVVDDITMGITTIIRGDDHVMNTPSRSSFTRLWTIHCRFSATCPWCSQGPHPSEQAPRRTSVTAYRDMGFLPVAMINYLVRLGWSHGDQEFFTRDELIAVFNLEAIGRAAGVFDPEKLQALNADHIKATPPPKLVDFLRPFMAARGVELVEGPTAEKVVASLARAARHWWRWRTKPFSTTLTRLPTSRTLPAVFDGRGSPRSITLAAKLEALEDYTEQALEETFKAVMAETGLKLGKIAQPVRVALSGRAASPESSRSRPSSASRRP